MNYKLICILYALLCGQNFILVNSGCYKRGKKIQGLLKKNLTLTIDFTRHFSRTSMSL
jgi:hypothetical protein